MEMNVFWITNGFNSERVVQWTCEHTSIPISYMVQQNMNRTASTLWYLFARFSMQECDVDWQLLPPLPPNKFARKRQITRSISTIYSRTLNSYHSNWFQKWRTHTLHKLKCAGWFGVQLAKRLIQIECALHIFVTLPSMLTIFTSMEVLSWTETKYE